MNSLVQKLVALIKPEQKSDDVFVGQTVATGQSSVFGGLVAGQAAMAASLTVPEERLLHSLHAYFLRPGDFSPITYEVDRIRDGRGFTTRRVNAVQHGKTIFTLSASFQMPEEGVEHQFDMPDVPSPDDLQSDERFRIKVAEKLPEDRRKAFLTPRPIEFKTIEPADPMSKAPQPPQRKFWFRLIDPPAIDELTSRALLTFCSDFSLMGTAMLPHGMTFFDPGIQAASLDHAMWFHRPVKMDDWLLYVCDSPTSSHARGINRGMIYSREGQLLASVAQEGLMRQKR